VEYGTTKSSLSKRSKEFQLVDKNPSVIELTGLKSNTKYYYRLKYRTSGTSSLSTGKTHSFSTAKTVGKSFSFSLHGDTHPERAGKMFNADLYSVTLANIAAQQPDFHILMGDDFSIDPLISKNQATKENVEKIYS
jgi:phosphodiesterase/alkaline phosphatase D-like protein